MATAAQRLEQAREARHKLVTGQLARVFMDQNGERVEFTATNLANLDAYIRTLETEANPSLACRKRPRPIGFIF
jgi:hypothetical protein